MKSGTWQRFMDSRWLGLLVVGALSLGGAFFAWRGSNIAVLSFCGLVFLGCCIGAILPSLMAGRGGTTSGSSPDFVVVEGGFLQVASEGEAVRRDWAELSAVLMRTMDSGPFACDLFLVLICKTGEILELPSDNPNYATLLNELQANLPLDAEQMLLANCSTEQAIFFLWSDEQCSEGSQESGV